MKTFWETNKLIITIMACTILIIASGIYLFSRKENQIKQSQSDPVILNGTNANQKIVAEGSAVTLVEFGDYQCPSCGAYYPLIKQLLSEMKGEFTFIFRNYPLINTHPNAKIAAMAVESAGMQGKFWEMHGKIYDNQNKWSNSSSPLDSFLVYAKEINLNIDQFKKDLDSPEIAKIVEGDMRDGNLLNVNQTPTFYLNGVKLTTLPKNFDEFKTLIKAEILKTPKLDTGGETDKYHAHFDLKIFANGKKIDLSLPKYQSEEGSEKDEFVHLHDENGEVIHLHTENQTLKTFLDSVAITTGDDYKVVVNGQEVNSKFNYVPQDLDQILITNSQNYQSEITTLTDKACIYSKRCPERGTPPTENCVGGLGTGCE